MNKDRRKRYLLAVYLLVATIAVVIALVGILYAREPAQSLLTNLATELLGVTLIFFLVNRLFLAEEWGLSERIDRLVSQLEQSSSFLKGIEQHESELITSLLEGSLEICLLGYASNNFLRTFRDLLTKRLSKGAYLRILIIDPRSDAAKLINHNSKTVGFRSGFELSSDYARLISEASEDSGNKGRIEVRLLDWIPSCSMTLIEPTKPEGFAKITIYPPCYQSSLSERAHFTLTRRKDPRWYNVFVSQYERLWEEAKSFDPKETI